jgi:hypothetical protein
MPSVAWNAVLLFMLPIQLRWQACTTTPSFWLRWGVKNFGPRLASNHSPRDLQLPSKQDDRHESPHVHRDFFWKPRSIFFGSQGHLSHLLHHTCTLTWCTTETAPPIKLIPFLSAWGPGSKLSLHIPLIKWFESACSASTYCIDTLHGYNTCTGGEF